MSLIIVVDIFVNLFSSETTFNRLWKQIFLIYYRLYLSIEEKIIGQSLHLSLSQRKEQWEHNIEHKSAETRWW